jgi:4-azaleucine resistance transporter AzlC
VSIGEDRARTAARTPEGAPSEATSARSQYVQGARAAAPIGVAALAFGLSFGLVAQEAGLGVLAPIVMSATTFAGSAQFAAVSIIGAGSGALAAIVAALLLNARYGPISISVAHGFRGGVLRRLLGAQLIVDETWALSGGGGPGFDVRRLLGAGFVLWPCWVGGTVLGVLAGNLVGDPNRLGLDAAFPALFLALLVPQLRDRRSVVAALLGAAIALVLLPFTPAGVPIIAASAACLVGLWPRSG